MNEIELLKRLARSAGSDRPPLCDVADAVLGDLNAPPPRGAGNFALALLATLTSAAAVFAAVLAWRAYDTLQDPVQALFNSAVMELH